MTDVDENLRGLTSAEAKKRLERYGKNEPAPERRPGLFGKALGIIREPMFLLLIAAAVIYFVLGEPRDGAIMLIFVIGIISIEVIQERKTDKTLDALKDLSAPSVTVMRDGRLVRTAAMEDITIDQVIHLITGRTLGVAPPESGATAAGVVLEVEALARKGVFSGVSFRVRSGEIVAIAGLADAGGGEIARAVSGLDRRDAGRVKVRGRELPSGSPGAAREAGIAFVPDDRRGRGLIRRALGRWGGSQDKEAVLAAWLARRPSVLIIDEPTRGMDAGKMARVHWLLDRFAVGGAAILMVSSELPEVLGMADRVIGRGPGQSGLSVRY